MESMRVKRESRPGPGWISLRMGMAKLVGRPSRMATLPVALLLLAAPVCSGADSSNEAPLPVTDRLPGVDLAEGITAVTGVAISPLLGVSVIGAWHYFRTAPELRENLPWFCHPIAWGIGLGVLALCAFKDVIGAGAPPLIKEPLDVIELFENKASAAVASVAFVPFVANQISIHFLSSPESTPAALAAGGEFALFATAPNHLLASGISSVWILAPLLVVAFLAVWVLSHTINVLILLSPFGLIDVGLKTLRLGLLAFVATLSVISPTLAAILCFVLITIAVILAPWAFRLAVFGGVMAGDLAASVVRLSPSPEERIFGFLARSESDRFKARSGGWISKGGDGILRLTCKRLFVGPSSSLELAKADRAVLRKGMFFPQLSKLDDEGEIARPTVVLLPRYRNHIETIGQTFGIGEIRETLLTRGFKGMLAWLKETLGIGRAEAQRLAEMKAAGTLPTSSGNAPGSS